MNDKITDSAFSLIELMIVIAIVGLLSAVAGPSYQNYIKKSKVAQLIPLLDAGKKEMMIHFDIEGSFPQTLFNGAITENNASNGANFGGNENIASIWYRFTGLGSGGPAAWLQIRLDGSNLNIHPSGASGGDNNAFGYLVYEKNGSFHVACGPWVSGHVDLKYLPSSCQDFCNDHRNAN